ncbi:MAG TPA: PadR family transcriptional regulator [Acidimicrobiia bacterium]|nr:PadR family transcriptional regulator [Acidimicrobiia bacterium]
MLELPILGLLHEEPMHGYELKKRLDETLGAVTGVSYGSLYPALRRLERAGAIEVVEPDGGPSPIPMTGSIGGETAAARVRRVLTPSRRKRKEYRITDRGADVLEGLLKASEDAGDERAFALKLAFCRHLAPEDRMALFERRRDWLTQKLARVRGALGAGAGPGRRDLYTRSLMEHDDEATERDLAWIERLIAEERQISGQPGAEQPA